MATIAILIWCGIVFVGMNSVKGEWSEVAKFGYFPDNLIFQGKPWGLLTSAFVHLDMVHAAFNLYWMWLLGSAFEAKFGALRLFAFVCAAAIVSSGIQLIQGSTGIGLSGVVYALFGFEWIAQRKYPEFAAAVTQQVITIFLVWGVICIPLTYLKILNVGNLAHFGGLVFGVLVAGLIVQPRLRALLVVAMAITISAAIAPAIWNPNSPDWLALQIMRAGNAEQWSKAESFYKRFLDKGGDPVWGWSGLAEIYGYQKNEPAYKNALERLSALDPTAAEKVMQAYGRPRE